MYKYLIGGAVILLLIAALAIQTQRADKFKQEVRTLEVAVASEKAKRARDRADTSAAIKAAQTRSNELAGALKKIKEAQDEESREWLATPIPDGVRQHLD